MKVKDTMENEIIIVKTSDYEQGILESIKQTVKVFKEWVEKHHPIKPTCNQELYVKDVEFLLKMIAMLNSKDGVV